ncbi:hypothetical protein LDENG_00136890, partial [Lucifuga dentata]
MFEPNTYKLHTCKLLTTSFPKQKKPILDFFVIFLKSLNLSQIKCSGDKSTLIFNVLPSYTCTHC